MAEDDSSSSCSEISDSELEDYEAKHYAFLKSNAFTNPNHRVRNPDGSFRCPFCSGKKKQSFKHKDLLQHASGIAASSARKSSLRATHGALARFLRLDLPDPDSLDSARPSTPKPDPQPAAQPEAELFVWPWTGILANVPFGYPLEERFSKFKPSEVIPLFIKENICSVIMRFNRDWSGFRDAMAFENQFKAAGLGRDEWVKGKFEVGGGDLYGWMAREVDFNGDDAVGEYLKRNGKVLTVSEVESEEARENGRMVALLASQIEVKNQHLLDLEFRYNLSDLSLRRILEDKNQVHVAFNESMHANLSPVY